MEQSAQQQQASIDLEMSGESSQVCCVKFSLMACNAFGIMLGIFVVLFGLAYPDVGFPGGYKGKETAGISGFFIVFTLIGYYGAHRQKIYFLVPYSVIIFLFLGGNLVMWGIKPEESVLDPDSNAVLILGGVYFILMAFALWLAFQERKKMTQGNVSINSTAGLPMQTATAIMPQSFSQRQQLAAASTGLIGASANPSPYGYQQNRNQLLSNKSWDIDTPLPLNVMYQPNSNSYVTMPASRYGSGQGFMY